MTEWNSSGLFSFSSLRGRESPPDGVRRRRKAQESIDTPQMAFETELQKVRQVKKLAKTPISPKRPKTDARNRKEEGKYAVRFSDATWGHTDISTVDHYATRAEIEEVSKKFDQLINSIAETDDVEYAQALQAASDMLLEEIETQNRAENLDRSKLVEKARMTYANAFSLLETDGAMCREKIEELERHNNALEENLTKVIDSSTERVREAQEMAEKRIHEMQIDFEKKKEDFDTTLSRFLEQKNQLEENVKALHRVFRDFQNDSVYITLEDLKQQQESTEKKLRNKEQEVMRLNQIVTRHLAKITEKDNQIKILEQSNEELRRKLQASMSHANKLQRRIELSQFDEEDMEEDEQALGKSEQKSKRPSPAFDSMPYINVVQKLGQISDKISMALQKLDSNVSNPSFFDDGSDKIFFSGNTSLMIKNIEKRVEDILQLSTFLETVEVQRPLINENKLADAQPRFIQFISQHLAEDKDSKVSINAFAYVRRILQAKYLHDKWCDRVQVPQPRMPEFILQYFTKDGDTLFMSLRQCTRLWKAVRDSKSPELKIFKRFATEKYTTDELTFFLNARYSLIGLPEVEDDDPLILPIRMSKCVEFLERLVGKYSPIYNPIVEKLSASSNDGMIDYAIFLTTVIEYYQRERTKRRNAVRLMFQSKRYNQGSQNIDFESFCSMIIGLGYKGPTERVYDLHREANTLAGGRMSVESLLAAMDNLSFHFYSIETTIFNSYSGSILFTREYFLRHWMRFNSWFEPFKLNIRGIDPWTKSQLIRAMKEVETTVRTCPSNEEIYASYRNLLDFFQFSMFSLTAGRSPPMSIEKAEKQLQLLENLADLLVSEVVSEEDVRMALEAAVH